MRHFASAHFWRAFAALPPGVQELARAKFDLLKSNPTHRSLHLKKAGQYWSVRISRNYRALGKGVEGGVLWAWIGSHRDYERMVAS